MTVYPGARTPIVFENEFSKPVALANWMSRSWISRFKIMGVQDFPFQDFPSPFLMAVLAYPGSIRDTHYALFWFNTVVLYSGLRKSGQWRYGPFPY
jgi:hypothetical protein